MTWSQGVQSEGKEQMLGRNWCSLPLDALEIFKDFVVNVIAFKISRKFEFVLHILQLIKLSIWGICVSEGCFNNVSKPMFLCPFCRSRNHAYHFWDYTGACFKLSHLGTSPERISQHIFLHFFIHRKRKFSSNRTWSQVSAQRWLVPVYI